MQIAIISLDIPKDQAFSLIGKVVEVPHSEWWAGSIRHAMEMRFGVFETQEAIKRAKETLSIVIDTTDKKED